MYDEIIGEAHINGKYYLVMKTGRGTIYLRPEGNMSFSHDLSKK